MPTKPDALCRAVTVDGPDRAGLPSLEQAGRHTPKPGGGAGSRNLERISRFRPRMDWSLWTYLSFSGMNHTNMYDMSISGWSTSGRVAAGMLEVVGERRGSRSALAVHQRSSGNNFVAIAERRTKL